MSLPADPPIASPPVAALAIVNAKVRTGDRRRPWADAVLVRGERIEIVGSSAEVKKKAGSIVPTIDAKGMMVLPGFIDAHVDFLAAYADYQEKELGMLAPGMLADLVMIDRDITRAAPETIGDARVMLTLAGGRVVYDRAGVTD